MQNQYYTFNMFDAQAWYARDVVLGRIKLGSDEEELKEWQEWRDREGTLKTHHEMTMYQGDYCKYLASATDYPSLDIEAINKTFLEWEHNKGENIMTFRDKSHKSVITGDQAPIHHTPWMTALDDSMKCYLDVKDKD